MQKRPHIGLKEVLHAYWGYAKRYPGFLSVVIGSSILLQVANLVAPLYLRNLFNALVARAPSPSVIHPLVEILLVIAAMWFLDWLSRRFQGYANTHLEAGIMADLQTDAFEYLLGHSHNFFISNFAGSLSHKVKQYGRSFETVFDSIVLQFFPTLLFVAGAVLVLFLRNHTLGLALGVWSVGFVWFQFWVAKVRQPIRRARAETDTRVTGSLADAIGNQSAIALFSATKHEQTGFRAVIEEWRAATLRLWKTDEWIWAGIGLFIIAIEAGLLYGAVLYWSRGLLTVGDFVLIQAYLITTFNSLVGINQQLRMFYSAIAEASEMLEVLEEPHEIKDIPNAKELRVASGEVTFDDVQFAFDKSAPVLVNFNLHIKGGEKIALVGPSGAGKSTITKLLLRLYDVTGGNILIDGQNIVQISQDSLREAIAFVPQEPVLFHRTLMENIRYGRRDASDAEVIEAAKKAHCHEFISRLQLGYETLVGERGVKLSGGERQRVAIARAILKNAPILVLDEATSSLDSESESLIQDALELLMRGKTVIVIAHRLSTIMKMDRIVVMDHGAVVATGSHLELVRQPGLYQKLWSIQAGGFIGGEDEENAPNPEENEDDTELADEEEEE
jgi:ATP-binding cassette subfamily B protein